MEDRYSILIRLDNQDSANKFYQHFNGRQFNSLEKDVCQMLFTVDVQFTGYSGSLNNVQSPPASSIEQPSCLVCLERLDQDASGILTTICNHSFHCSCISKWTDSSCPFADIASSSQKSQHVLYVKLLRILGCVSCGFVGCGRYKGGHAIIHWKETQHCYFLELEMQRVRDYVGDNYVHRLIQSKTDGMLVELNAHCQHVNDGCGSYKCDDYGISEAILNNKVEAIVNEYNELLATQLENQKLYFETLLQEVKEETEREVSEAVQKAVTQKLLKLQAKLDRCVKEKKFLDDLSNTLNENILKNQEIWRAKLLEAEEREKKTLRMKNDKIHALEEQLKDLMATLEARNAMEHMSISDEIKDATALSVSP